MDEYFCPNCGAILNDQAGFDPSCGAWTCRACGMELMDDDVFEVDTYEGIAWYCDECGALLNRQEGFSDSYGSWTCTKCGHSNGITEEDIDISDETSDCQEESDSAFICPNCGKDLSDQFGFCAYCDDWTCSACRAHLHHDYSDDPYIIVDDEQSEDDDDGQSEDDDDDQDDDDNEEYSNSSRSASRGNSSAHTAVPFRSETTKGSFLHKMKSALLTSFALIIAAGLAFAVHEFQKRIPMTYDSDDLIGLNYEDVIAKLGNAGFTHVWAEGTEDLELSGVAEEHEVYEISVSGETAFDSQTKFPYDIEITVKYHALKRIPIPFSSTEVTGMNYLDVISAFRDAGFANICTVMKYDVIIGWITKDGEVEKVTINDEDKFDAKMRVRPDAEITVIYHTYRRNKA